jgi:hypothetical protein
MSFQLLKYTLPIFACLFPFVFVQQNPQTLLDILTNIKPCQAYNSMQAIDINRVNPKIFRLIKIRFL